jgi:intein/homing endonuclease
MAKEKGPVVKEEKTIYENDAFMRSNNISKKSSYLAGLFEGDGHI